MAERDVTNIVFVGLGGQGVLRASDILAEAAFLTGHDVKKSEIHGMSQRGGSVSSDVRYGAEVFSPMTPPGEADYLVVLHPTQIENNLHCLREGGMLITTDLILGEHGDFDALDEDNDTPVTRRNFNIALLGALSTHLDIPGPHWTRAICKYLPEKVHAENLRVFEYGRAVRLNTKEAS